MEEIRVTKEGEISKNGKKIAVSALAFLGNSVLLDENFTLTSFFQMIRQYPELKILSELFETYLMMIPDTDPKLLKSEEIKGLVFFKTIEIVGFPGKPAINIYNSLKGRTDDLPADLKFFHLEEMLGHRLSLGPLRHIVFGDQQDEFRYDTIYTLFELIDGISWELSFNFNPLECSIRR